MLHKDLGALLDLMVRKLICRPGALWREVPSDPTEKRPDLRRRKADYQSDAKIELWRPRTYL